MTRFSANLGFLWTELPLPEAIRAAHRAGFDAVECHWPYAVPRSEVLAALTDTGLPMLGLNTVRGNPGENGLAALPGREAEARAVINQALDYAAGIGCGSVHVMAGYAEGPKAEAAFLQNLTYACTAAQPLGITILIEPLNHYDAPGYFLQTTDQAARIIRACGQPNLRLLFDCYHVQIMEGDITRRLTALRDLIGHIQIASVPERASPAQGELDYLHVCKLLRGLGWTRPLGAEYRPNGAVEGDLDWMDQLGQA